LGGDARQPWLEGRSFLGAIEGTNFEPREFVVAELDYFARKARLELNVAADQAKGWMVRSDRWKYVFYEGFKSQLFDLESDPSELTDRAADPSCQGILDEHRDRLFHWFRHRKSTVTVDYDYLDTRHEFATRGGFIFGEW